MDSECPSDGAFTCSEPRAGMGAARQRKPDALSALARVCEVK